MRELSRAPRDAKDHGVWVDHGNFTEAKPFSYSRSLRREGEGTLPGRGAEHVNRILIPNHENFVEMVEERRRCPRGAPS